MLLLIRQVGIHLLRRGVLLIGDHRSCLVLIHLEAVAASLELDRGQSLRATVSVVVLLELTTIHKNRVLNSLGCRHGVALISRIETVAP